MEKILLTAILTLVVPLSFAAGTVDEETACKAVLCLSGGLVNADSGPDCILPVSVYASHRVYDHKKFNATATAALRDSAVLRQCSTADSGYVSRITAVFGPVEDVKL